MLIAGSAVGTATAVRLGAGSLETLLVRSPGLLRLATISLIGSDDAERARLAFRDELLAMLRASAEDTWRELRRAVDDLDARTRPPETGAQGIARPYRVKP